MMILMLDKYINIIMYSYLTCPSLLSHAVGGVQLTNAWCCIGMALTLRSWGQLLITGLVLSPGNCENHDCKSNGSNYM
jgi:hypothetical protein